MNNNPLDATEINSKYDTLVFIQLTKRELANSYKGAVLGVLWMLLRPVITALILFLVFRILLNFGDQFFLIFVLIGVLAWNFLSSSLLGMTTSLKRNSSIIKNIPTVQMMFPMAAISSATIEFFVGLSVLFPMFLFYHIFPSWNLMFLPIIFLIQFSLLSGLGLMLSVIYPVFPDVRPMLELALRLLYFASPVFYNPEIIQSELLKEFYMYNPVATLMALYRWSLIGGDLYNLPAFHHIALCVFLSFGFFALGIAGFNNLKNSAVKNL
jgi:ABC-type polysaccharide/polyol phosphate export permease